MEDSLSSSSSDDSDPEPVYFPPSLGESDGEVPEESSENGDYEEVTSFSRRSWMWQNDTGSCSNPDIESHSPRDDDKAIDVLKGAGLWNLGNTCFLNAVLQCFMHTVPLLDAILSAEYSVNCKELFCALCALRKLVELSLDPDNVLVFLFSIFNNLSYFSSSFQKYQQEDAHEFLQCFLDKLEKCHDLNHKHGISSQNDNIVKEVFGGRLLSKLKCQNCGHCSNTYEPSIDLSLEIEDADNLLMALESFTKLEKIDYGETKFTCDDCKEQVPVEKQLAFDQTPSVAIFHLKRFKYDGWCFQKNDKHVAFPLELDLMPFIASGRSDDAELRFVLYAVVVHVRMTSTCGHYYCFVRLSPTIWCKFDDSEFFKVSDKERSRCSLLFYRLFWSMDFVLSEDAYILFYAKEGTSWFSSYIETLKSGKESDIQNTSPVSILDNARTSSTSPETTKTSDSDKETDVSTDSKNKPADTNTAMLNDDGFSICHDQVKLINRKSCKRKQEGDTDDLEREQACSLREKKNLPSSRSLREN